MTLRALLASRVFDGTHLRPRHAVLVEHGICCGVVPWDEVPGAALRQRVTGLLTPGFVDLQANGGGGVMFNAATDPDGLRIIAEAHRGTGTTALLPTLITDTPERTSRAIEAVVRAIDAGVPGLLGLHLEGPHLDPARKGAHDAALIRPLCDDDLSLLCAAAARLPNLMVTLAPEAATAAQIATLSRAGVLVSLGHSECSYDAALSAFRAGAQAVTHLFNAMSGLTSRAPGLVGAALDHGPASAGVIADGIHVHPATLRLARAAKAGPGRLFLVTDAMAPLGTTLEAFDLNGRRIRRAGGRLTLEDGTLAGADLSMPQAIAMLVEQVGVPLEEALQMATSIPAGMMRNPAGRGSFAPGSAFSGVLLHDDLAGVTVIGESAAEAH